jgi:hypothetical protein
MKTYEKGYYDPDDLHTPKTAVKGQLDTELASEHKKKMIDGVGGSRSTASKNYY